MVRFTRIFAVLTLVGVIGGCAPTAPSDPGTPNALVAAPDSLTLTKASPTAASVISLVCGCEFAYSVTNVGDTSNIKFALQASTGKLNSYTITANAAATAPSGTYTSWISLSAPDADVNNVNHTFYDTLHVKLIVP